ncbi:MAG: acyltransferase [Burkholderiaceae bacterium]|jgi:peptidoglycan/LPS O-acetylase OafA/YrhL|nr:acyltransferase [Burkholderiaceae bacterium]
MRGIAQSGNRFDMLRLTAALAVLVAHGEFLYRLSLPEPFAGHSLGSLAVYVFFFMSGYLVMHSWSREPAWHAFWAKRLMRIFPGLVMAVVFSVFVIGWAMTSLPFADYWRSPQTWNHLFNNMTAQATVQTLPGVFESNPFAYTVNGSLWTLRYELAMYLALVVLAWCARGRRWVHPLVAVVLAVLWQLARVRGWDQGLEAVHTPLADMFRWRDFCGFGVPFFLGSTMAAYGVVHRPWMALAALALAGVALVTSSTMSRQVAVWGLVALACFYLAHAGREAGRRRWRVDLSYGVYIYAFPVQQALTAVALREGWSLGLCLLLSLALTLVLAWLSWHAVERPAMLMAQRWLGRRASRKPAGLGLQPVFDAPLPVGRNAPGHAAQDG